MGKLTPEAQPQPSPHVELVGVTKRFGATVALDAVDVAAGDDVGATGVFVPVVDGRTLSFGAAGDDADSLEQTLGARCRVC